MLSDNFSEILKKTIGYMLKEVEIAKPNEPPAITLHFTHISQADLDLKILVTGSLGVQVVGQAVTVSLDKQGFLIELKEQPKEVKS